MDAGNYDTDAYRRGMEVLERLNDPELLDAYKRYVARLQEILTPEEFAIYLDSHQHSQSSVASRDQPTKNEISEAPAAAPDDLATDNKPEDDLEERPEVQSVTTKVWNDTEARSLYERYLKLLSGRQLLDSRNFDVDQVYNPPQESDTAS